MNSAAGSRRNTVLSDLLYQLMVKLLHAYPAVVADISVYVERIAMHVSNTVHHGCKNKSLLEWRKIVGIKSICAPINCSNLDG